MRRYLRRKAGWRCDCAGTVRGTQSFVHTLSECWRRPSLTALEVLWRWAYGIPALLVLRYEGLQILQATPVDLCGAAEYDGAGSDGVGGDAGEGDGALLLPAVLRVALWLAPVLVVVWVVVSAVGRTVVLRRADGRLHSAGGDADCAAGGAGGGAAGELCGVVLVCGAGGGDDGDGADGGGWGAEPGGVFFAGDCGDAGAVYAVGGGELGAVGGSAAGDAAGVGVRGSLAAAFRLGPLKSKLVEINLVMGIVKIALIVLAMVFSATPLPFESVTTPEFLMWWWVGVTVLYFVGSDFFHVARQVAYLQLWRAYEE